MDELFARLQKTSTAEHQPSPPSSKPAAYREPSVSSPVYSPSPPGPQPHQPSNVLSPNTSAMNTPQPESSTAPARSTDLLSLLKFRQNSSTAAASPSRIFDSNNPNTPINAQARIAPADILATSFTRRPSAIQSPTVLAPTSSRPELRGEASGSSSSPQDFLLKLLNQAPKPSLSESLSDQPIPQAEESTATPDIDSTLNMSPPLDGRVQNPRSNLANSIPLESHRETVSEALSGVGELVDKQVAEALAQAASKANGDSAPIMSKSDHAVKEEIVATKSSEAAKNEQPTDNNTSERMEETPERHLAKDSETANIEEDWEKAAEKDATTYTLPMQPFKSIQIVQFEDTPRLIPQSMTMDIARVKRPFDQIDRNLVAATQNLMIYPLKNGGLRVIRQETGVHKEIFKQVQERIFNVSVSVRSKAGSTDTEVVLATGVDGSVFWASLSSFAASDDADVNDVEDNHGFVFPPVPSSDENTSGGLLKTRIKPSCRHPNYFAYGRGKSIYIVYPSIARSPAYCDSQTRVCKSEKYLKEHMLRISTGKAGKDFIFSADDSLILSLDKAGRLKFWDIRNLVNDGHENSAAAQVPLEIKTPLMTLATCPATEKSWPTSIHLVDKEKPMTKGIALRYVIIGLKQNHTLQLWDLMLGKPVQEISFPHEQESDAICSVVFHPKTSIVTIAHPTRNSIYFLHLSIPPYTLGPMSQSKFVNMVAEKDATLPPPQSTIIVNGVREYKFSTSSTIRSLDILADPGSHYGDETPAFVLYIMHSNGISELKVDRAMLGLSETSRVVGGVPALSIKDAIRVDNIKPLPPAIAGDNNSVTSESASAIPSNGIEDARKGGRRAEHTPTRLPKVQDKEGESSNDKPEKKKKKEKRALEILTKEATVSPSLPPVMPTKPMVGTETRESSSIERKPEWEETDIIDSKALTSVADTNVGGSQETTPGSHASLAFDYTRLEAVLKSEFENLQHGIAQDRLKQDAAAATRQEAILKAVSRTLTENIEDSLSRVVVEGLTKVTVSPLRDMVTSTIDRHLSSAFNQAMKVGVPRELQKSLPVAVGHALKDKEVMHGIADSISRDVGQQIDAQLKMTLQNAIIPAISKSTVDAISQMTSDMERRLVDQIRLLETQKQQDNKSIMELHSTVSNLQQTVAEMSQIQQKLHQESMAMLAQIKTTPVPQPESTASTAVTPAKQTLSPAERESHDIQDAFARNEVEEATLKWMHSERKIELFDEIFLYVDPRFLNALSPLLILSVAATVSENLGSHLRERLRWVDFCLTAINTNYANELQDVLPSVLDVILQRIQQAYMQVSQKNFQDPMLKDMHLVARKINDLKLDLTG